MAKKRTRKGNLLAIDIGSHSVKVAVGQQAGGKLKIAQMLTMPLPGGVYDNGMIEDAIALKAAIQSALHTGRIKVKDAVVSVESTEIIKREMLIPYVEDEDRDALISYEVSQYLPIDISDYVLQHKVLETVQTEEAPKTKILLGAMPKEMAKAHFDLLIDAGLNPVFMDMHSNSIEKLLTWSMKNHLYELNKTYALIDFGHKMIDVTLIEKGEYRFNRLIKMGGGGFDDIITRHLNLPLSEAESRKSKTSVSALIKAYPAVAEAIQAGGDEDVKNLVVYETVNYLNDCLEEIDKVFKYYTSRQMDNSIDAVLLYGGTAAFSEILGYMTERLGIPVSRLDDISGVDFTQSKGDVALYANALGALIRI